MCCKEECKIFFVVCSLFPCVLLFFFVPTYIRRYVWTQTLGTVEVMIDVPAGTTAKQCQVTLTPTKLNVKVKGEVIVGKTHRVKLECSEMYK